jgi:hypothetical protein
MSEFDIVVSIALGVGLAAAVGFRVFVPLLVMSGAAYTGHLTLSDSFAWLATPTALAMLSVAAIAEILAYYVPGVDNLLDAIATPAALVAGTIAAAAVMTDLSPIVKWTTAVIAGGGAAAREVDGDDRWVRQRGHLDRRARRCAARLAFGDARTARGGRDRRGVLLARRPLRAPAVSPDAGGTYARMSRACGGLRAQGPFPSGAT